MHERTTAPHPRTRSLCAYYHSAFSFLTRYSFLLVSYQIGILISAPQHFPTWYIARSLLLKCSATLSCSQPAATTFIMSWTSLVNRRIHNMNSILEYLRPNVVVDPQINVLSFQLPLHLLRQAVLLEVYCVTRYGSYTSLHTPADSAL